MEILDMMNPMHNSDNNQNSNKSIYDIIVIDFY